MINIQGDQDLESLINQNLSSEHVKELKMFQNYAQGKVQDAQSSFQSYIYKYVFA